MASKELMDKLNDAIAREMQVSIQYMWQHVQAVGVQGNVVGGAFRAIGIVEMQHAELIAERLFHLGGKPTTKPDTINVGEGIGKMLEFDIEAEKGAIAMYRDIINLADSEGDIVTRNMFEDILTDEENHLWQF
ncbi:bacterioferritin, partial [candidate division KSB1 bacterium]